MSGGAEQNPFTTLISDICEELNILNIMNNADIHITKQRPSTLKCPIYTFLVAKLRTRADVSSGQSVGGCREMFNGQDSCLTTAVRAISPQIVSSRHDDRWWIYYWNINPFSPFQPLRISAGSHLGNPKNICFRCSFDWWSLFISCHIVGTETNALEFCCIRGKDGRPWHMSKMLKPTTGWVNIATYTHCISLVACWIYEYRWPGCSSCWLLADDHTISSVCCGMSHEYSHLSFGKQT